MKSFAAQEPSQHEIDDQASCYELQAVGKVFHAAPKPLRALKNINLKITTREFVCILGESGCGKSSLLKILAGLEHPSQGRVLYRGRQLEDRDGQRSMVFQQPSLFPWLTVVENIQLSLKLRRDKRSSPAYIQHLLRLFALESFANYYPRQLSGGMQQRVAIARSLLHQPETLLLDEPFAAVDAITRRRLQSELLELWKTKSLTTIFVTHDVDEALLLGTRILVLSPRPGTIIKDISLRKTRQKDKTLPNYLELREEILRTLNDHSHVAESCIGEGI